MNKKSRIKHLPVAAMALLLGVSGGYILTAQGQPIGAHSQSNTAQPFCSRNAPLTDLALVLGICGNYGVNAPEQVNATTELWRPLKSSPSRRVISYTERYVSELSCGQDIPQIAEEWVPLIDEEFDVIEWNDDAGIVLQDA